MCLCYWMNWTAFFQASVFNSDLSNWAVSRVTNMEKSTYNQFQSFFCSVSFLLNIITCLHVCFANIFFFLILFVIFVLFCCLSFNYESAFYQASAFNSDVSKWAVLRVTTMRYSTWQSILIFFFFCIVFFFAFIIIIRFAYL